MYEMTAHKGTCFATTEGASNIPSKAITISDDSTKVERAVVAMVKPESCLGSE